MEVRWWWWMLCTCVGVCVLVFISALSHFHFLHLPSIISLVHFLSNLLCQVYELSQTFYSCKNLRIYFFPKDVHFPTARVSFSNLNCFLLFINALFSREKEIRSAEKVPFPEIKANLWDSPKPFKNSLYKNALVFLSIRPKRFAFYNAQNVSDFPFHYSEKGRNLGVLFPWGANTWEVRWTRWFLRFKGGAGGGYYFIRLSTTRWESKKLFKTSHKYSKRNEIKEHNFWKNKFPSPLRKKSQNGDK